MKKNTLSKNLQVFIAIFLITFLFVVSSSSLVLAQDDDIVRVSIVGDPPTLDVALTTDGVAQRVMSHVYDTLYAYDENFKAHPQLAKSSEISDDKLTWTIHLREGIHFHDGTELTSEDARASILRFIKYSPRGDELDSISSIEIVDRYTFKVHTESPQARLIALLAEMSSAPAVIMPKHVITKENGELKGTGDLNLPEDYIGTGPFELVEWESGDHILLKRSEEYEPYTGMTPSGFAGDRTAEIDKVEFLPMPEASSRLAALQAGEIDVAVELPSQALSLLQDSPDLEPHFVDFAVVAGMINKSEYSILSDVRLRQAMKVGLDQKAIMQAVTSGRSEFYNLNCGSIWFEAQRWWTGIGCEIFYSQNDKKKANQLMEEAGYNNEKIIILSNKEKDFMYKSSIVLLDQLRELGFNAELRLYDWNTQIDLCSDPEEEWHISYTGFTPRFDASGWYGYLTPRFIGRYDNERVQELIKEDQNTFIDEERMEIWQEINEVVQRTVPFLTHGELKNLYGAKRSLEGFDPFLQYILWNVSLEK